jgi:hypothetical protein
MALYAKRKRVRETVPLLEGLPVIFIHTDRPRFSALVRTVFGLATLRMTGFLGFAIDCFDDL